MSSYSVADLLAEEFWAISKKILELTISDSNSTIAMKGLQLYASSFKTAPSFLIPELYMSFTQQLYTQIQKSPSDTFLNGLDLKDAAVVLRLKQHRLLSQVMMLMPTLWARFSENQFKQVMSVTASLLKPLQPNALSPLHYLAIVDPDSKWFHKWMISHFGRSHFICAMKSSRMVPMLAEKFLEYSISQLSKLKKPDTKDELLVEDFVHPDENEPKMITATDIEYLHFLQVTTILAKLMMWSSGRQCFPIPLFQSVNISFLSESRNGCEVGELTKDLLLLIIIKLIYTDHCLSADQNQNRQHEKYRISLYLSKIVKELINGKIQFQHEILKVIVF